jgi:hypothetical protein
LREAAFTGKPTDRALYQSCANDYSEMWLKIKTRTGRPRLAQELSDPSFDGFSPEWRFFGRWLR